MGAKTLLSNRYLYEKQLGLVDMDTHIFKVILMNSTFKFDPDSDDTLADITADQLTTANGYTQNDKTLSGVSVTRDDTNNRVDTTFNDVTWTANGGSIGPTGAAAIYDDSHANDIIVGVCDFGQNYTIPDGQDFELRDILFRSTRVPDRDTFTTTTTTTSSTTTTTTA